MTDCDDTDASLNNADMDGDGLAHVWTVLVTETVTT